MKDDAKKKYFDADFDRQLKRFPKKWMDPSRFKVGDKIEFLDTLKVCTKYGLRGEALEWTDLNGQIGVVQELRRGYGEFPPRYYDPDGGDDPMWIGEHAGWLVVKFPFDIYRDSKGNYLPRACLLEDEGIRWRKVK